VERAVIVAALQGSKGASEHEPEAWQLAALAEAVAPAEPHGSEPTL
jgi:hypothetical protein